METIAAQGSALDALDDRQSKELEVFESSLAVDRAAERDERRENELKFEKIIVDRLEAIQQELVQECQRRELEEATRVNQLREEVGKMRAKFEAERKRIEALDSRLRQDSPGGSGGGGAAEGGDSSQGRDREDHAEDH